MFGSEKNCLCLVWKRTLITNLSTIETKHVEGSHITVGQVCHQEPEDIILDTETHVVVYWNGILTTTKCKYIKHIVFKHSFFS